MTSLCLHDEDFDLPPGPRRMAALQVAGLAEHVNLDVFFKIYKDRCTVSGRVDVVGASPEERKAHADRIAEQMGAATTWRNGYYMATMTASFLGRVDPPVPVEVHFNPPIFASDMPGGKAGEAA